MKIGFIGLGVMGLPMAGHVLAGGYDLTCFNRSPEKMQQLVARGARSGRDARDTAAEADIVITMLPDSPEVEQVVIGDGGVLAAMKPGALLIDCSTVHPATSRAVAAAAGVLELSALDAPVSGGEAGAVAGKLSVMAGGLAEDVDRARPVLGTFSASVQHVGGFGSGQTVKAAMDCASGAAVALPVTGIVAQLVASVCARGGGDLDHSAVLSVIDALSSHAPQVRP
jgi:2-hydroxy-3-oxopropionate reductase